MIDYRLLIIYYCGGPVFAYTSTRQDDVEVKKRGQVQPAFGRTIPVPLFFTPALIADLRPCRVNKIPHQKEEKLLHVKNKRVAALVGRHNMIDYRLLITDYFKKRR